MEILVVVVLAIAAIGTVFYPLIRREAGAPDPILVSRPDDPPPSREEVDRYREALRAGSLCSACGLANPRSSRFCAECGRRLAGAENGGRAKSSAPEQPSAPRR